MRQTTPGIQTIVYLLIIIVPGAIYLIAGIIKGIDLDQFALQIRQNGRLPDIDHFALGPARVLVVLEIALGAALIFNWRQRPKGPEPTHLTAAF